jgi:hypothetical protein
VKKLRIAAVDKVFEGGRGRLGEVEEELPHGGFPGPAQARKSAAGLARARLSFSEDADLTEF